MNGREAIRRLREWRGALGAIAAIGLAVIVVSFADWRPVARPPVVEPAGFAVSPEGEDVARLSPITVTFPAPPQQTSPEKLLHVAPATRGSYVWMTPRTLLFQPEFPGLLRGATYTVSVPAGPASGLAQTVQRRFQVTGLLTVQQTLPADGDVEVPLDAHVIVQFSRSVAPLTTLSAQPRDTVVTFDPPLEGEGEWLNTSIYRFVPKQLAPSTTYRMTVRKGLTSAADGVLLDDVVATFRTVLPGVASIAPADNTQFAAPRQPATVRFNQPMDESAAAGVVVRHQASNTIVPGGTSWSDDRTSLTFTPAAQLEPLGVYVVSVEKGLRGARGGETSALRTSSFRVVGRPQVTQTVPSAGERSAGRYGVNVRFSNPMDAASLEGLLSISGVSAEELEGNVFTEEGGVFANITLRPSTAYTVRLAAGARDRYGQAVGPYSFSFTTGALPSTIVLAVPGYGVGATFSSTRQPVLFFQTTNLDEATFTLYPLSEDEGKRALHDHDTRGLPSRPPIRTWTERITAERDTVAFGSTALTASGPLARGYYFMRTGGQFRSEVAFAVVDTAIVTKLSNDQLLTWALDHDTGRPVAGATVRADGPGVSPASATTDANGLATFGVPLPRVDQGGDRSYYLTLDGSGHRGVTSTRWGQGISPFELDLPSDYFAREWVGQIYTDRPIYRPGESIEFRGILRADDDARYALPVRDPPLEVVIFNARGQEVLREDVRPNDFGTFAGRLALESDAPVGDYQLSVRMKAGSGGHAGFVIFGNSVAVIEFRRPEFQVELSADRAAYVDGDAIAATTTASYYFGGAVADAPVTWSVLSEPYVLRPAGYERYSFADVDPFTPETRRDSVRARGSGRTGAGGGATFSVPAVLAAGEGAQRFTIGATVTDQNAQAISASAAVTVHPADVQPGVRPAEYVAQTGTDARIDLVAMSVEGTPRAGQALVVKVYDRRWITTKEELPGGGRRYTSVPRDTLLGTLGARTDAKGEASVSYRPEKAGTLRVVAEATDARGRTSRSAAYLWVWGGGFASWQVTNDDAFKLIADKERYEVGDVAEVLVPAPFEGAIGLVTTERGKIITREVRDFATNSEVLRIPIEEASLPNVFVSVVLYRGPTAEDPLPRFKVGYVQLSVSTATRVLDVKVRPDREQARPGDTVRYEISVTDRQGRPVRSEVSVAVVDKGVLALQEERGPDGLRAFWFERGLGVTTASSMTVSVDRWNDAIAEAPRSGKGGSGIAGERLRQDFRNTAYWTAQLATDGQGRASVEVKLPDNLTTWRMQVRAVSGDTMVGEGLNELVSTEPLLIRPALPRFLRVGDSVQLRAVVRNATGTDSDVTVVLDAAGLSLEGDAARKARIPAGGSVVLSWPASVRAEGTARLTFAAVGSGGLSDNVAVEVPVYVDLTPETTATGGVVVDEGTVETIYLPPYARTDRGSLTVALRSALSGAMADELAALEPRPLENAVAVSTRLVATIGVRRAETSAGLASGRDGRVAADLAALAGRQRPDGGWAWCDDPRCESDPYVTGLALFALGEARRDGLAFDAGVLERATRYVFAHLDRPADVLRPADPSDKAFFLAALAAAGAGETALTPARALFEQQRAQLTSWGRAYLLLALGDGGVESADAMVRALVNDLSAAAVASANGSHWEDEVRGRFMSPAATTAIGTLALARLRADHPLLPQTVRWLVVARSALRWHTEVDRAFGVLALTTYAVGTGELAGDYRYRAALDERELLSGVVRPGTAPVSASKVVPLSELTPGEPSFLSIEREAARGGRLYYSLDLRYATPAQEVEAVNRGFAIAHRYTSLDDPERTISDAALGETIRVVVTVIVPAERDYVVVSDPLPAGLEPVDARLRTVDPELKARLEAERRQEAERHSGGGYFAPWFSWYFDPWQHVDLRDDGVRLYADRLPKGLYEYVYYARATAPGDFFAAPPHAEETFFPEVFGRGDSGRFGVTP